MDNVRVDGEIEVKQDAESFKAQKINFGHKILFSSPPSLFKLHHTTYSTMTIAIAVQGSTPIIEKSDVVAQPTSKDVSIEKDYWNNL